MLFLLPKKSGGKRKAAHNRADDTHGFIQGTLFVDCPWIDNPDTLSSWRELTVQWER